MVALLQRLGILSSPQPMADCNGFERDRDAGSYPENLTKDQINYLHEIADERRRAWMAQKQKV